MKHNSPPTDKRRLRRTLLLGIAGFLLLFLFADLFFPLDRDLRGFDPGQMTRLETAMWQSYYDRKPVKTYFELAEMLRTQFDLPYFRSFLGAYYAARAAFVFKDHQNEKDLKNAEDLLRSYFGLIRTTGNIEFDVGHAAETELRWWIVHRRRDRYSEEELGEACAIAASTLYRIPAEKTGAHGLLRAQAMTIRDTRAKEGGVREEDWKEIERLLLQCYESLKSVLRG